MRTLFVRAGAAAIALLADHAAWAQETKETDTKAWTFSATANTYVVPDEDDFVSPVVMADRGWLHLEARYNYEGFRTGSIWLGYNFGVEGKLAFDFTAMVGGVMGNTRGVAPGYRFSLRYWKVQLLSESEYVFDTGDSAQSFFYTWSELSVSPVEWLRAGGVVQRTRLYGQDRDVQRGFLVGFSWKSASLTTYVFNPDAKPTVVVSLGVEF